MKSKAVMFVCLLFLSVLVMASAVSEPNHDQAVEVASEDVNPEESKQGSRCRRGCCQYRGRSCVRCCPYTTDEPLVTPNVGSEDVNPEESKQGSRCRRGCCQYRGRYCARCCPYTADEPLVTPNVESDDVNPEESKQGIGRCRRGCCLRRGGRCVRCCPSTVDEAATVDEAQTTPNFVSDDTNPEESKQIARCRRGCCLRRGHVCVRCCPSKADEAQATPNVDEESEVEPNAALGKEDGGN